MIRAVPETSISGPPQRPGAAVAGKAGKGRGSILKLKLAGDGRYGQNKERADDSLFATGQSRSIFRKT